MLKHRKCVTLAGRRFWCYLQFLRLGAWASSLAELGGFQTRPAAARRAWPLASASGRRPSIPKHMDHMKKVENHNARISFLGLKKELKKTKRRRAKSGFGASQDFGVLDVQ